MSRYTVGGALVGDVVKLKANTLSHADIKGNAKLVEKLKELLASDLNLRIVSIKNKTPIPMSGDNELNVSGRGAEAVIAQEIAPSRYHNHVAVPLETLEVTCTYPNLPPIPDSWKHKTRIDLKPVPVAKAEQNEETPVGTAAYMTDTKSWEGTPAQGDKAFRPGNQTMKSNVDGKNVEGDRALPTKDTPIPSKPATPDPAAYIAAYMPKKKA